MRDDKMIQNAGETSSVIANEIRNRIMTGQYKSGDKVREINLCKEFDVSRTPVRDAFRMLQHEGLLVYVPQRGVQVAEFGIDELLTILEVRTALECLSARSAALHATKEHTEHLRYLNGQILEFDAYDAKRTSELDIEFHLFIAQIGKNTYTQELLANILTRFQISLYLIPIRESRIQYTYKEHEDIIAALEKNDSMLAESYMKIHFHNSSISLSNKLNEYNDKLKEEKRNRRKKKQ